ncbi:MAG: bifunctional phosphopantothenoylcysteine decarboxylase/phosphopantothenate--cysteine ligase CoaBC, partial [Acidimicrobiia bacterium]|nr:bifunctional phosphopantothenoylcysteine decarboxylase/phosphopantothenate--cysteine ligase CoaBC [Acidimicrobiia bacterium]
VRVVMSESSLEFIGPQTFAAITGHQPITALFGDEDVSPHTHLARWADLVIVAPATAATLSRAANGLSEGLVSALLLATTAPILFAPAMHTEMWESPATQRNVEVLTNDGHHFVGPASGELAGGDVGMGRLVEPEEIVAAAEAILDTPGDGIAVLVTAGGTREPIDPVRYISNRSSGKMGHAIAEEAADRGYQVTLVTTSELPVSGGIKVIHVDTAEEMQAAVDGVEVRVAVMAAAVADFKPSSSANEKLARSDGLASIELTPTPDILASVVARDPRPLTVGFAAETGGVERAVEKARRKKVDLLVYNNVSEPGSGFGTDTNRVTIISSDGGIEELPLMSKALVAREIWDRVGQLLPTGN